ncbi:MAG: tetratricopeptide repeat protein, partial [Myxococcota bacterium]
MASGSSSDAGNTRSIRARLVLADQLTRDGDLTQAASVYAQVAESYASAGRAQESIAIATRSQQLGPAWFTIKTVGKVLDRLQAQGVPVCTRAAEAHWRAGRVTEALQFYYQATQLDPDDAPALIRLAQAYEHQTLYKEATATFVVASRRLLQQGSTTDFIAVAEQILRIDGGHAATLRELAKAYLHVGEPRRAVAKLTALMQVVPEDPAGYEILAQAFACIGKEDVALSVLTRLSDDLRDQGLDDDAADLLWRASRWLPDNLPFQRKVAALANDEIPTKVTDDDEGSNAREGVMTLGPEDMSQLDEDSGVYRDREGTNMLSLQDIAILDDLLQSGLRDEHGGMNTVTRADTPNLPSPPKRAPPKQAPPRRADPEDPPTKVMGDDPPTQVLGEDPPTRVTDDAPTR